MLLAFIGLRFLFKAVGFHRDSSFFHRKCETSMSIDDHVIARDWLPLNTWISTHIVFFFFLSLLVNPTSGTHQCTLRVNHLLSRLYVVNFYRTTTPIVLI